MDQKEADHMDEVINQFTQLKSVIEIQAMMGALGTGEAITYTPMTSTITMGSKELPYFVSARSYGQITLIDEDDAGDYKINIQPAPADFPTGIPLTSIEYDAQNAYFVDQKYVLEGGGIILQQHNGEVMRVHPGIAIENHSGAGYIKISYFIPVYTGVAGKKSVGGYQDGYVHTNYTIDYSHSGSATFIHIYTDYPDAWEDALVNESRGVLYEYIENGYVDVQVNEGTTPNRVEITPDSKSINVDLTIAKLKVEIGYGYVVE